MHDSIYTTVQTPNNLSLFRRKILTLNDKNGGDIGYFLYMIENSISVSINKDEYLKLDLNP